MKIRQMDAIGRSMGLGLRVTALQVRLRPEPVGTPAGSSLRMS